MEVLGALISEKCEAKLWDPVKVAPGGIAFLHLFFTDDLVLFAKADQKNCVAIKDVLETFCELSGQKVNDKNLESSFLLIFLEKLERNYAARLGSDLLQL